MPVQVPQEDAFGNPTQDDDNDLRIKSACKNMALSCLVNKIFQHVSK